MNPVFLDVHYDGCNLMVHVRLSVAPQHSKNAQNHANDGIAYQKLNPHKEIEIFVTPAASAAIPEVVRVLVIVTVAVQARRGLVVDSRPGRDCPVLTEHKPDQEEDGE